MARRATAATTTEQPRRPGRPRKTEETVVLAGGLGSTTRRPGTRQMEAATSGTIRSAKAGAKPPKGVPVVPKETKGSGGKGGMKGGGKGKGGRGC